MNSKDVLSISLRMLKIIRNLIWSFGSSKLDIPLKSYPKLERLNYPSLIVVETLMLNFQSLISHFLSCKKTKKISVFLLLNC